MMLSTHYSGATDGGDRGENLKSLWEARNDSLSNARDEGEKDKA